MSRRALTELEVSLREQLKLSEGELFQLEENLKALEVYKKWDPETESQVREILKNDPEVDLDWRSWQKQDLRRNIAVIYPPGPAKRRER